MDKTTTGSDYLIAAVLVACLLPLYFVTHLQVHNQVNDFTNYAAAIQTGHLDQWLTGNHLIYVWLLSQIYHLLKPLMPTIDAFTTAQAFNSLMASLGLGVFYLTGRTIHMSRWLSLSLTLVLAFTYRYWLHATGVEVLAPAVFFYLLSLLIALRLPASAPGWQYAGLGILTALAILFHIVSSLTGLVIVALILLRRDGDQASTLFHFNFKQLKNVLIYGLSTTLGVIIPYAFFATQVLHLQTANEIYGWLFPVLENPVYTTTRSFSSALPLASRRIVRAVLGNVIWVPTPLIQFFPQKECLQAEAFLVRNVGQATALALTVLSVIAGGLLAAIALLSTPGLAKGLKSFSRVGIALMLWLILYSAFILWFTPGTPEPWGTYWFPIFYLMVGFSLNTWLKQKKSWLKLTRILVATLVLCLFTANLGNVLPQTNADNDMYLQRLNWYQTNTQAKDLIISAGGWMWAGYTAYYLPATIENLDEYYQKMDYLGSWHNVDSKIQQTHAQGGRVFVMQDIFEPDPCLLDHYEHWKGFYAYFRNNITPRLTCFDDYDTLICEVVRY